MVAAMLDPIKFIHSLYDGLGAERYSDEVTQEAHALQAAALAEAAGADSALITAGLLHDIGHLLHKLGESPAQHGINARHESIGARRLALWFGPEVTEPIRHHVAAKRYLCALEPDYFAILSPGSVRSLALQGGPFSRDEAARFIARPHAEEAVRLRRWDEQAKVAGAKVPPLEDFLVHAESCLTAATGRTAAH
jgi:phosphonate degradation associated HDIG domain protein